MLKESKKKFGTQIVWINDISCLKVE